MFCANEDCPQTSTKLFLCSRCKDIRYCSKNCQLACLGWHKKICIDPNKTVFNLMKSVFADDFEVMNEELKASYGFEKCKTPFETQKLFGLYAGLIKFLDCDLKELDQAFQENKLPEFIVSTFFYKAGGPKTCGGYFKWYIQNIDICRR
ncbi:hypothetical protein BGZ65_006616 [Modicella reniformis]|uniref:MYND-type domain-containing protein n=1 Tax=Modicella reniformis TaxID=1440133 RepID=A0A9P6IN70_9FUNG|nr:hypothetical protein BGZ65_006616 [Modicella reniformis]